MQDALPLTIPGLIARNTRERPHKVLLACDDQCLTYSEADARSRIIARGLIAVGVGKGSHVALLYPAGADFIIAMLAAARIGAVVVPLSTLSTPDELRGLLTNSDSAFLLGARTFHGRDYPEVLQSAFPELEFTGEPWLRSATTPWLRHIWFSEETPANWNPGWSVKALEEMAADVDEAFLDAVEARVLPADRFVILHSSGSTGTPKGVLHCQGSLIRHLTNTNKVRRYGTDDVFFTTFPWFWNAGFAFGLLGTIIAGGRIVVSNSLVPSEVLDLLERERPTITNGFWRSVTKLAEDPSFVDRDLSFLRRGNLYPILAADVRPTDPSLRHDIYGMSETGGAVALDPDDSDLPEHMRGSCGRFLPEIEARIVDPESLGDCPAGQQGELWLRGPLMAEGYYGKPRSATYSTEGWYRTGDIGVIDEGGYFYLKGRMGEMIKTSTVNVSPREVEAVLGSLTANRPCVVFGIPDEERGELVVAVVVSDDPVDEAALMQALAEKLSSYKIPRRIFGFRPAEMPLLSTGKFDIRALSELVLGRW